MSRIHEALRKAAQERAAVPASAESVAQPESLVTALKDEVGLSDVVAAAKTLAALAQAPQAERNLQFEQLLAQCVHTKWQPDPNVNVFSHTEPNAHGAEQFRTLRSRLYQLRNNQPLRTLLVTSAIPGEGKTFVAGNLAQAIVRQSDRRAILIDADLRRPRLHVPLGAPSAPGLTDYLRGATDDERSIIQHGQEGNLCFIAGGNEVTNPSELLSSGKLKDLLGRLGTTFDWIILDSPPCVPVADANILADLCDGVLLVVRAGATRSDVAQKACQELHAKVVGVVLNAAEEQHLYGSYYHYQGMGYADDRNRQAQIERQ